jgi:hypothetical protein
MQPTAQQLKATGGKAVEGAWYGSQRYMGGKLLAPGQDQPGHDVSAEVIAQTNPANVAYVNAQRAKAGMAPAPSANQPAQQQPSGGGDMGMPQQPTLDVNSVYNSSFNTPEIAAANKALSAKQAEIEGRKRDLATREAEISDDPWLSESQRVGKVNKLREKANADIGNLTSEYTNLQGNLTTLRSDASTKVDLALKQYDINSQAYQQNLQKLNMLISNGALAGATPQDLAGISSSTGISSSMLQSIVKKAGQTEPYLTTVQDGNGNYTVLAIDKNTGSVINRETISGIGNAEGGKTKATSSDYADLLKVDARGGKTLSQIFSVYSGYLDPDLIYSLYNSSSRFGPAKETPEQLAKYGVKPINTKATNQNPFLQPGQ